MDADSLNQKTIQLFSKGWGGGWRLKNGEDVALCALILQKRSGRGRHECVD